MGRKRRRFVGPTGDWEQLDLLRVWEEQREYKRIRPLVLFGGPVPDRSAQTGTSDRVLYRRIAAFCEEGMESLFAAPKAKRRVRRSIPAAPRGPAAGTLSSSGSPVDGAEAHEKPPPAWSIIAGAVAEAAQPDAKRNRRQP